MNGRLLRRIFGMCALITSVLLGAESSAAGNGEITYELAANEFAFVGGIEFRVLHFMKSADGAFVNCNGVPVSPCGSPAPLANVTDLSGHVDVANVPFVAKCVADGMPLDAAMVAYAKKIDEFGAINGRCVAGVATGKISAFDWQVEVNQWLANPSNAGVISEHKFEGEELSYRVWSERIRVLEAPSLVILDRPIDDDPVNSAASGYLSFFASSADEQLLVVNRHGGGEWVTAANVGAIVKQLREVASSGKYVKGPKLPEELKRMGFTSEVER